MDHQLQDERGAIASFHHKNNITVGKGRVLWARATVDTSGTFYQEGWVLPGGRRTNDSVAAHAVAAAIHEHAKD